MWGHGAERGKWASFCSQQTRVGVREPSYSEVRPGGWIRMVARPFVCSPRRRGGAARVPLRKRKCGHPGVLSSESLARAPAVPPAGHISPSFLPVFPRRPRHAVSRFFGRCAADEQTAGEVGRPLFPLSLRRCHCGAPRTSGPQCEGQSGSDAWIIPSLCGVCVQR